MLGNVILSVPARVRNSLLGIHGNGDARMYPLGRFPTELQARLRSQAAGVYIREVTISLLEENNAQIEEQKQSKTWTRKRRLAWTDPVDKNEDAPKGLGLKLFDQTRQRISRPGNVESVKISKKIPRERQAFY